MIYYRDREENRPPATELLVEDAGNESWEVDGILDSRRTTNGRVEYLVKWTDFGIEDCTWEPLDNLATCQATVRAFHKKNPDKPNGATIRKERNTRKEAGEKRLHTFKKKSRAKINTRGQQGRRHIKGGGNCQGLDTGTRILASIEDRTSRP